MGASGTPDDQITGLDGDKLEELVPELFVAGLTSSTRKTYASRERRYSNFCAEIHESLFPVTQYHLSRFIANLYGQCLYASTIKGYLAAVWHALMTLGLGDPVMTKVLQLQYILRGACCNTANRRLPITPDCKCLGATPFEVGCGDAVCNINVLLLRIPPHG